MILLTAQEVTVRYGLVNRNPETARRLICPPLNGTKTHPLRPGTIAALRRLAHGPVRSHQLNPGVRDRLLRGGLATEESAGALSLPGARARQYEITAAGRAALAEIDKS